MADVSDMIVRDVGDDVSIAVSGLAVEVAKKGLFSRRKNLVLKGIVKEPRDREKIAQIALHHAGDLFDIDNQIEVREPATT